MINLFDENTIKLIEFIMQFGVVPVLIGLWKIHKSVEALTITLYRDFATKSDLDKKVNKR